MVYEEYILINKEEADMINRYLTVEPESEEDCLDEDETIVYSATFPNGKVMDIKCCGVQYEEGSCNTAWSEAVLFEKNGLFLIQVNCTDVSNDFLGEWRLDDENGNTYVVHVVVKEEKNMNEQEKIDFLTQKVHILTGEVNGLKSELAELRSEFDDFTDRDFVIRSNPDDE